MYFQFIAHAHILQTDAVGGRPARLLLHRQECILKTSVTNTTCYPKVIVTLLIEAKVPWAKEVTRYV